METTSPTIEPVPVGPTLSSGQDESKPVLEHLEEIRRRVLRSLLWVGLGTALAWHAADRLLALLIEPAGQVVFLSPVEPFMIRIKVAFFGGLLVSFPLLAWEGWGFLTPALKIKERWTALLLLPASIGLFLLGAWFGWQVLLPVAFKILLSFGTGFMTPMLTVGNTVGFSAWLIMACGLLAQIPLLLVGLTAAGLLSPQILLRQWRLALLITLMLSAVLTPTPDIATQLLLSGPLVVLYLISIGLAFLVGKKER